MYGKLRTQRSSPSRLNGVAPKNRFGTSLVRKKWRTSEMFFNRRRDCPDPGAKAASVPTLISVGLAEAFVARLTGGAVAATVLVGRFTRLAGLAFLAGTFLAGAFLPVVFVARRDRTGRSVMVCTSLLASDSSH